METEIEKYQRWLDGKEKAKKMWFEKYQKVCRERDNILVLWRQANTACTGRLIAVGGLCGLAGFVIGWFVFGG